MLMLHCGHMFLLMIMLLQPPPCQDMGDMDDEMLLLGNPNNCK